MDSYINNALPPKIQIDINTELAHKIIDECDFLSPYLFLEAYVNILLIIKRYRCIYYHNHLNIIVDCVLFITTVMGEI